MIKNYSFWLKSALVLQLLTASMHSLSFLNKPIPTNEKEMQLLDLMSTVKLDLGAGFAPTMDDIAVSFSVCFTLLCLLGGLINWHLMRKQADISIVKGIIGINAMVFGICFLVMARFTFLIPISLTGCIFLCLMISRFTIRNPSADLTAKAHGKTR